MAMHTRIRYRFDIRREQVSHLIELGFTSVDMATTQTYRSLGLWICSQAELT